MGGITWAGIGPGGAGWSLGGGKGLVARLALEVGLELELDLGLGLGMGLVARVELRARPELRLDECKDVGGGDCGVPHWECGL